MAAAMAPAPSLCPVTAAFYESHNFKRIQYTLKLQPERNKLYLLFCNNIKIASTLEYRVLANRARRACRFAAVIGTLPLASCHSR